MHALILLLLHNFFLSTTTFFKVQLPHVLQLLIMSGLACRCDSILVSFLCEKMFITEPIVHAYLVPICTPYSFLHVLDLNAIQL